LLQFSWLFVAHTKVSKAKQTRGLMGDDMRPLLTAFAIVTALLGGWTVQAQEYEYGDYFGRHDYTLGLPPGPGQVGKEGPTPPNPFGPSYAPQTMPQNPQFNYGYPTYQQQQPQAYPTYPQQQRQAFPTYPTYPTQPNYPTYPTTVPYQYPQYGPMPSAAPVQSVQPYPYRQPQQYQQRPIPVPMQPPQQFQPPQPTGPVARPAPTTNPAPLVKPAPTVNPSPPTTVAPPAARPAKIQAAPPKVSDPNLPDVPVPPDEPTSTIRPTSRGPELPPISESIQPNVPSDVRAPAVPGHLPLSMPGHRW
jgi:hypothetical protein